MWDLLGIVRGLLAMDASYNMPADDCPLSTCSLPLPSNDVSLVLLQSGESAVTHSTQVAQHGCVQTAMPDGLLAMGYVCLSPLIMLWLGIHETGTCFHSHRGAKVSNVNSRCS